MKNILLIAKAKALHDHSRTVGSCHIQTALNNVTIDDQKMMSYIYKVFNASYKLPEAHYSEEMLSNKELKSQIKYDNYLKKIFTQLKNENFEIDIMNISKLNALEDLEYLYLDFADTVSRNIDNEYMISICNTSYIYDPQEAIDELGISQELVDELVEDYVEQILRTFSEFNLNLSFLWEKNFLNEPVDFGPLRDLAHKNLGVAKNLRIEDGISLLTEIKKQDDLEIIAECLDLLISCAIKLKPKKACEAMFDSIEQLKRFQKFYSNKGKILQTIKN
ncbi:hypothetical protein KKA17_02300 [bacterium]|nr:hypothetical protein [bacterium]MBU1884828.1 hypothetical protein [bacterium]